MRIHSLQHVPFEDIGSLIQDVKASGHSLTTTHWYKGDSAPELESFDLLVVMGGPMGVYDDDIYPWLAPEKEFIAKAIAAGKKVMGICLGAQLIACVLGAQVTRNVYREIGWFPLEICADASSHPVAKILAECKYVFHWHGDTFAIPPQAQLLASSKACANQAYVIDNQVYGFQFHLETTEQSAAALIKNCAEDLDKSTYVQSAEEIMKDKENFIAINKAMSAVFNQLLK
ncbi:amidotransferase [Cellvibrio zantedeschiae]|uniref:Amidotransferase n=1 Tax=Cellvibrio zantedeschiae TaxID=1237077 RepID=A0ABQ3B0A6_9GAMM|nr:type 1 glutamine amidotransferase [Cellvibrio zantedeschiae]GGY73430.1 amidotransferase [Cellvibrio zantedeschiae]